MAEHSAAAEARNSHSIASAVHAGITVWYALLGGIGAWTIHLLALASLVQLTCNTHGYEWVMHLTTVVTLAMTALAIALSWRLAAARADESADTEGGRDRFVGRLGLVIGVTNALLISLEELYVFVLHSRRCG